MTTSTPPDNTVLVLYPPEVNGQTTSVVGAHIGVPLVAYDLVTDGEGAVVLVDPPLSGTMDPGDVMELWLENEPAALDSETIEDPDGRTTLRIPKGRLHPDEVNKMYYTVRRGSDNRGISTPPLEILYNRIRPGLKDRFPEIDGHSELGLDLSDLIKQGVGKDFVSAPVCFRYPYCRAYDTISLKCNGEIKTFPVSNDQAPEPPNPGTEKPTTVCFTVEREFLDKAKRQNKVLNFSYTVTDQLLNGPDPDAVWSAAVAVNEDLDGTLLDMPILREIIGDTADEPGIIDLKKLGSNPLLLYISTVDPRFEPGDKIEATYTAKIPGEDDKTVVLTGQVETDDIGNKITCLLKVLNKDVIVATSVSVKYKLLRKLDDTLKAESNIATATVEGEYMELKPAGVQQATGNSLAPMAAVSKLTIVVPQGTTHPTDLLNVSWIPEPGTHAEGSFTSDPRPISEIGLSIDIPPSLVAFCLGGRVTVSYTITRGNGQPQPSDPFILNVQELPQAELIAPRLKEASNAGEGSELNLAELTPEGKMWCSGFPFNAVGQYVWLLFRGTNADDSTYDKYIWAAPFAFVNDDWVKNRYFEATAPYEDLKGLKDGTPLTMEMWVAFGKSEDLGLAKRFLLRTYTVSAVQVVVPAITSVKGTSSDEEIPPGSLTVQTDITLTGTATPSTKIDLVNGSETISDDEIPVDVHGDWTARLRVLVAGNTYNLRAKRKDGELSAAHDLVVVALVKPTLDNVLDDKGVEVPDRATTVSTTVKLKGKASYGQKVEIFDGSGASAVSKGIATASERTGEWEREIEVAVQDALHRLYAKSLYHSSSTYSNVRHVGVTASTAPILTSVKGSPSGVEIPQNGTTVETAVTLSGIAAKGQQVEIFDGATSKGKATADPATGKWELPVSGLSAAVHNFKASAVYAPGVESAVRTLTVTAATAPTLTSVKGSPSGVEIPQNGTTVETAVTLSGIAAKGQQVEIFDGATSKGKATADPATGKWELPVSGLSAAVHNFKASAVYAPGVESAVRTLTVTAATAPTLTSVKGSPSGVEIPQNGTTVETAVTLSGIAAKGQKVEIFDGAVSKGPATADPTTGVWTLLIIALAVAAHSFTAKALYGSGAASAARTLTVTADALEIDTSPMVLDGPHFYPAPAPHIPPFDTTAYLHDNAHRTREARGGNPPYQYSSSDLNVASVDPKTGHVVSTGIGTARITARDERGATNSYEVSCKNVYELVFNSLHRTHAESMAWLTSIGAQPFPHEFTNDPTAQAASFSFQKVSSSPYHYWYTAKTSNPSQPQAATCFTRGYAQWVTPPYSKGINFSNETVDVYSPYQTIGFKARRF